MSLNKSAIPGELEDKADFERSTLARSTVPRRRSMPVGFSNYYALHPNNRFLNLIDYFEFLDEKKRPPTEKEMENKKLRTGSSGSESSDNGDEQRNTSPDYGFSEMKRSPGSKGKYRNMHEKEYMSTGSDARSTPDTDCTSPELKPESDVQESDCISPDLDYVPRRECSSEDFDYTEPPPLPKSEYPTFLPKKETKTFDSFPLINEQVLENDYLTNIMESEIEAADAECRKIIESDCNPLEEEYNEINEYDNNEGDVENHSHKSECTTPESERQHFSEPLEDLPKPKPRVLSPDCKSYASEPTTYSSPEPYSSTPPKKIIYHSPGNFRNTNNSPKPYANLMADPIIKKLFEPTIPDSPKLKPALKHEQTDSLAFKLSTSPEEKDYIPTESMSFNSPMSTSTLNPKLFSTSPELGYNSIPQSATGCISPEPGNKYSEFEQFNSGFGEKTPSKMKIDVQTVDYIMNSRRKPTRSNETVGNVKEIAVDKLANTSVVSLIGALDELGIEVQFSIDVEDQKRRRTMGRNSILIEELPKIEELSIRQDTLPTEMKKGDIVTLEETLASTVAYEPSLQSEPHNSILDKSFSSDRYSNLLIQKRLCDISVGISEEADDNSWMLNRRKSMRPTQEVDNSYMTNRRKSIHPSEENISSDVLDQHFADNEHEETNVSDSFSQSRERPSSPIISSSKKFNKYGKRKAFSGAKRNSMEAMISLQTPQCWKPVNLESTRKIFSDDSNAGIFKLDNSISTISYTTSAEVSPVAPPHKSRLERLKAKHSDYNLDTSRLEAFDETVERTCEHEDEMMTRKSEKLQNNPASAKGKSTDPKAMNPSSVAKGKSNSNDKVMKPERISLSTKFRNAEKMKKRCVKELKEINMENQRVKKSKESGTQNSADFTQENNDLTIPSVVENFMGVALGSQKELYDTTVADDQDFANTDDINFTDSNVFTPDISESSADSRNTNPIRRAVSRISVNAKSLTKSAVASIKKRKNKDEKRYKRPASVTWNNELEAEVHHLMDKVNTQHLLIQQASKALRICLMRKEFENSEEHVESERVLLLAYLRKVAATDALDNFSRILNQTDRFEPNGEITLKNIVVPLRREKEKDKNDHVDWYIVTVTYGSTVLGSKPVLCVKNRANLVILDTFVIPEVAPNFKIVFELHHMNLKKKADISHENKYRIRSNNRLANSWHKTFSKIMQRSNQINQTKIDKFLMTKMFESSFVPSGRVELFLHDLSCETPLTLKNVPQPSRIAGQVSMSFYCKVDLCDSNMGFLDFGTYDRGSIIWNRRWCVLEGHVLKFWDFPQQNNEKEPIQSVDLMNCTHNKVKVADRDICTKPRSILIEISMPTKKSSRNYDNDDEPNATHKIQQNFLTCDTTRDLDEWLGKINNVLEALSSWNVQHTHIN